MQQQGLVTWTRNRGSYGKQWLRLRSEPRHYKSWHLPVVMPLLGAVAQMGPRGPALDSYRPYCLTASALMLQ